MKKLVSILLTLVFFVAIIESGPGPWAHKSHGNHGLGNVNQNFIGVPIPPPWDNPPGLP